MNDQPFLDQLEDLERQISALCNDFHAKHGVIIGFIRCEVAVTKRLNAGVKVAHLINAEISRP